MAGTQSIPQNPNHRLGIQSSKAKSQAGNSSYPNRRELLLPDCPGLKHIVSPVKGSDITL